MNFNPILFRHQLHRHPEISGRENWTSNYIANTLRQLGYKPVTGIGGYGVVVKIDSDCDGPNLLFRADIDALPIDELSQHDHVSECQGVMHACGHDGHAASLVCLASRLRENNLQRGSVHLVFQPSEENGRGAEAMLQDNNWQFDEIDYCFGYHNIPGYPIGQILTRDNTFSFASTGIIIKFEGTEAHAAYPEQGVDPTPALIELIQRTSLIVESNATSHFLVTIIHVHAGQPAFGTTPKDGTLMLTARSNSNKLFDKKCAEIKSIAKEIANKFQLLYSLTLVDNFKAIVNHSEANLILLQACKELGFDSERLTEPMRWSEDFSHFSSRWPSAFFGIGSGNEHPTLHDPTYDFPDTLIDISSKVFEKIIRNMNGLKTR
ncbi:amidohydrolase [Veronia pacifica]|uniref:Hydrolase n=1 Tax=Veronia pacifica TaxID=1080227 RepID=A0A1C3EQY5_9GAMM|nr:amidohydrolase [Veronia pacifica]ODA35651.1 hydrolase [Veronia pacifica]